MTTKKCNELCEELGFEMESIKEDDGTFHIVRKGEVMLTKQQYIKDVYNFLVSLKEKMDQNPDFDVVAYLVGGEVTEKEIENNTDYKEQLSEELNESEREAEQELEDKERDSGSGESEEEIEEPDPEEQITGEEGGEVEEMIEREKSIFFEEEE